MNAQSPVLYRNGSIYSASDPFATAMLVDGDTVAWVGSEHAAESLHGPGIRVVDLAGALVTPGFVDSHVHTTETGLALASLDLTGVSSVQNLLGRVEQAARREAGTIIGHGWDEAQWPDKRRPTAAELDSAAGGRFVYLARADVHSAVVSGALAADLRLHELDGWDNGFVVREAHVAARTASRNLTGPQRSAYQRAALSHAAANGFVAVTEMAAPHIAPASDLESLLLVEGINQATPMPEVLPYWGELVTSAEELRNIVDGFGGRLAGIAGDLNVDGSIGSRTAALRDPYSDASGTSGTSFLDEHEVAAHVQTTSSAGVQAGFHVIGDAGLDTVLNGFSRAADAIGVEAVRKGRHRLEHVELLDDAAIDRLVHFGITVSAQPAFDHQWGSEGNLYSQRLGAQRTSGMNRFASMLAAGVPLCLGSDSPVTPLDPWASVRSCVQHSNPSQRISARAAFLAHTRAGWRAVGSRHPLLGQLLPGAPASYAVWQVDELMVQTPDSRVQSWSTDPRAGTPLLPALDTDSTPRCLETVHFGQLLYQSPDLAG